ncbi:MAG: CarD family transcriptional regulator [Hyphomicrobiaceae bacterium]
MAAKKATTAKAKPATKAKKAGTKKPATATAAKKASATKAATKTAAKKTTAKKPAVAKKAAPKKAVAKKATKKAPAKAPAKSTAKKPVTKAAAAKKPAAKKAPAKAAAKTVAARKAPAAAKAVKAPVKKSTKATPAKAAEKKPAAPAKPTQQRGNFRVNEYIVYPAHGVGKIVAIETQEIAGISLELFVINFTQEKMTLRVPTTKATDVGMRKLSDEATIKKALTVLKGRARIKRTMWSRRAQEYDAKINSGSIIQIAEVVRDLYRAETQPEQSYSERQLYEAALDRMSREVAAVEKLDEQNAVQKVVEVLSKTAKAARKAAEDAAEAEATDGAEQAA